MAVGGEHVPPIMLSAGPHAQSRGPVNGGDKQAYRPEVDAISQRNRFAEFAVHLHDGEVGRTIRSHEFRLDDFPICLGQSDRLCLAGFTLDVDRHQHVPLVIQKQPNVRGHKVWRGRAVHLKRSARSVWLLLRLLRRGLYDDDRAGLRRCGRGRGLGFGAAIRERLRLNDVIAVRIEADIRLWPVLGEAVLPLLVGNSLLHGRIQLLIFVDRFERVVIHPLRRRKLQMQQTALGLLIQRVDLAVQLLQRRSC